MIRYFDSDPITRKIIPKNGFQRKITKFEDYLFEVNYGSLEKDQRLIDLVDKCKKDIHLKVKINKYSNYT